jgi:hypothetical protein
MADYSDSHAVIDRCINRSGVYFTDRLGRSEKAYLKLHPECEVVTVHNPSQGGQAVFRHGRHVAWGGTLPAFNTYKIRVADHG